MCVFLNGYSKGTPIEALVPVDHTTHDSFTMYMWLDWTCVCAISSGDSLQCTCIWD